MTDYVTVVVVLHRVRGLCETCSEILERYHIGVCVTYRRRVSVILKVRLG